MPSGQHTRRTLMLAVVAGILCIPLTVLAVANEDLFAETKDQFNELWHAAAETTERRDALEQSLERFDLKVAEAKKTLEVAVQTKEDVNERLQERRKLIAVLTDQIKAAGEADLFYRRLAEQERGHFTSFLRYVASKETASEEAGPGTGKPILHQILRGSLGESVDQELAYAALTRARTRFLLQVKVLVAEAGKAQDRLQRLATALTGELQQLEGQSKTIGDEVDKQSQFIEVSWRQRKLTEDELKDVAVEAAEASERMSSMQASLLDINAALQEERLQELRETLAGHERQREALKADLLTAERKDEAMRLLEEEALRSMQAAQSLRNTDRKLYKRIEERELLLAQSRKQLDALTKERGTGSVVPGSAETGILTDIDVLSEEIALMRDGIPLEAAVDRVRTRRQAEGAEAERRVLQGTIATLRPKIAAQNVAISATIAEMDAVRLDTGIDGLPPIFGWPVKGPLTATYLDPDYVGVFGVQHNAVDIAVPQGSPVHAIADGIVYAVKDGGATGYSYILIGHQSGFASLYGHVSLSMVQKGDKVRFGQTIALSGGTPGTHGAGHMTTGAHLHLEMMRNGKHLNPLSVLPTK